MTLSIEGHVTVSYNNISAKIFLWFAKLATFDRIFISEFNFYYIIFSWTIFTRVKYFTGMIYNFEFKSNLNADISTKLNLSKKKN